MKRRNLNPFESLRSLSKAAKSVPDIIPVVQDEFAFIDAQDSVELVDLSQDNSIKSSSNEIMLIQLQPNQGICFQGKVLLAVVQGSVECLGFVINEKLRFHSIYSPSTHAFATINSTSTLESKDGLGVPLSLEDVEKVNILIQKFKPRMECTVFVIKNMCKDLNMVEKTLPLLKNCFGLHDSPLDFCIADSKLAITYSANTKKSITNIIAQNTQPGIYCFVGAKNSGKSTISRYLINQLLSKERKVVYLECDLGQPEYTPPGIVSLHVVKSPLLGPPFTHHQAVYHGICIGDTSPKQDPDNYLESLIELIRIYQKNLADHDLVVNTCGWVKGVGFDVLYQLVASLKPTDVIFIQSQDSTKQIPIEFTECKILEIQSPTKIQYHYIIRNKLNAADQRVLHLISYFHSLNYTKWDFSPIYQRRPYRVSFHDIRIKFILEVPFSQSMYALNGTIVGLIIDQTKYNTRKKGGFVPPNTPLKQNCVGLGLISAIDIKSEFLYVITPVPLDILKNVGLMLRGAIDCPVALLGIGPYTTSDGPEGIGSAAIRNRPLGRKRLIN